MRDLVSFIREADDFFSLQSADYTEIQKAEALLGLHFSKDYKEYLSAFGAASFNGKELTGICNSERISVVFATEKARRFYPLFPNDAYVIEDLNFDHIIIIQFSSGAIYSYGPNDSGKKIASSLQEYLFPA